MYIEVVCEISELYIVHCTWYIHMCLSRCILLLVDLCRLCHKCLLTCVDCVIHVYWLVSVVCTLVIDFMCQLYSTFHCQLVVDVVCCTRCFWCHLVQRTKCQCKAVQDSMSWKGMQEKRAQNFSKCHCWFQYGRLVWRENLVGIWHKYLAHSAKFVMWTVGKSREFLEAEDKRMLLFSHFLYCISVSE